MTDTRKKILLVLPEVPYPLRANGLSLRYFPVIERLSRSCSLDLLITGRHSVDAGIISALSGYCRKITCIQYPDAGRCGALTKLTTRISFALPWAMPRGWIQYGRKDIQRSVAKATENETYDFVICVAGYNYPVAAGVRCRKFIADFVDSPSLLAARNAIGSSRPAAVRKYEWLKMMNWEAKIIRKADAAVYISGLDAGYIPALLTPGRRRTVIPNGFSADEYTDSAAPSVQRPNIGFLGNMSYFPNIESAHWLHDRVFKPLREKHKNLNLYIIGRSPDASIAKLAENRNVQVTGAVENIWPFINAVDIFVFPLLRGAGLKNKILEALYAGRPVVTSPIGNEGLDAVPGRDLIVCKEPAEFRREIDRLLRSPAERTRLGEAGRRFVSGTFGWERGLAAYEKLLQADA
jgi:glycosyltransferase involved in cell wall biosynthesis